MKWKDAERAGRSWSGGLATAAGAGDWKVGLLLIVVGDGDWPGSVAGVSGGGQARSGSQLRLVQAWQTGRRRAPGE